MTRHQSRWPPPTPSAAAMTCNRSVPIWPTLCALAGNQGPRQARLGEADQTHEYPDSIRLGTGENPLPRRFGSGGRLPRLAALVRYGAGDEQRPGQGGSIPGPAFDPDLDPRGLRSRRVVRSDERPGRLARLDPDCPEIRGRDTRRDGDGWTYKHTAFPSPSLRTGRNRRERVGIWRNGPDIVRGRGRDFGRVTSP